MSPLLPLFRTTWSPVMKVGAPGAMLLLPLGVFLSTPLASSLAASPSKDLSSCILVPVTLLVYILKSNNCKGVGRGNSETIFTCALPVPSLYSLSRYLASPPCAASQLIKLWNPLFNSHSYFLKSVCKLTFQLLFILVVLLLFAECVQGGWNFVSFCFIHSLDFLNDSYVNIENANFFIPYYY